MQSVLIALALIIIGYTIGSVKIIDQGTEALVQRLGRYHRKLTPGLNFIVPMLDQIVLFETTREKVLDIEPQEAITKDSVPLTVDAVIYWRILSLERTFYAVENVEEALRNLVVTTLRSEIGRMNLEETFSSRAEINHALLHQLDDATETWGVKVTRVEVQQIEPSPTIKEAMEQQRAAESKRLAMISEAEGKRQSAIAEAEGTVESLKMLSAAMQAQPGSQNLLKYMVARQYVEANYQLGKSNNSKIVFMDPKALTEAMSELISPELQAEVRPPADGGDLGKNGSA
jgi:regulator of protease activity HflC (stomatin/prohibitin superfamily)